MLHSINLFPWREAQRADHKRRFLQLMSLGVLVALLMQWGTGYYLDQQQQHQQARLDFLNQHLQQLDQRLRALKMTEAEHQALQARLSVVESLQQKRNKTTQLMNLMPELIPEGVYVDKISMKGDAVEVSGISDSTARLATMLDKLERSPHLSAVGMHSIVAGNQRFNKDFQSFKVSFHFHTAQPGLEALIRQGEHHG
ncbi:PilN domain-containing protein [Vibrio metschnikovii]|uniref:PilN domain-containing protein n=1 Tax=Vibrio metschnikovii TaxID=28172 RepID=A0A9X0R8Q6_VIBME|nr:PilN domain-containing protein [Vibrio metschnikovii]MBC5851728.1 PilN domain-containing protein [Vibrio metschnikovii]